MGIISRIEASPLHSTIGQAPAALADLTPTQMKVLHGVHSGLLNKQIAFDLGIAEATVKAHMTALMRKLNVRNRTQVAIAAQAAFWSQQAHEAAA
ncbi:helix-turn-helix domain-containing protein [Sphingomonas crusticola]|uniref:helix-turn-helix domain-containing protein n=1 Tax=Sphingomonas crusticola TaxID=1697973 RepID=UPI0023DD946E|nr:LuxR C-terminal-related transcriptional regulator [Sphingomonas crusticola]